MAEGVRRLDEPRWMELDGLRGVCCGAAKELDLWELDAVPGRLGNCRSGVPATAPDADNACDEDKDDCEMRDAAEVIASGCWTGDHGSERSLETERRLG